MIHRSGRSSSSDGRCGWSGSSRGSSGSGLRVVLGRLTRGSTGRARSTSTPAVAVPDSSTATGSPARPPVAARSSSSTGSPPMGLGGSTGSSCRLACSALSVSPPGSTATTSPLISDSSRTAIPPRRSASAVAAAAPAGRAGCGDAGGDRRARHAGLAAVTPRRRRRLDTGCADGAGLVDRAAPAAGGGAPALDERLEPSRGRPRPAARRR